MGNRSPSPRCALLSIVLHLACGSFLLPHQSLAASRRSLLRGSVRADSRKLQAPDLSGFESVPVQVQWFFGSPQTISQIGQGEMVQWSWWDTEEHSVEGIGAAASLFTGKGGGTNLVAEQGFIYNHTFDEPGEFSYRCSKHPEVMIGKVIVKPKLNPGGVTIPWFQGVSYGGASAVVEEGDTVTWEWYDDLTHSLVSAEGDSSLFPGPGGDGMGVTQAGFKYKKTFTKTGIFLYLCAQHGDSMKGNITVVAKGSLSQSPSPSPSPSPPPPTSSQPPSPPPPVPPVAVVSPPPAPNAAPPPPIDAGDVTVTCTKGQSWSEADVNKTQYNCILANSLPVPVKDIQLACSNFAPITRWNINPDCSLERTNLGPKQSLSFGFITAITEEPTISVAFYFAAQPNITVIPQSPPSTVLVLNCSAEGVPWMDGNDLVYQYGCELKNQGTKTVRDVKLKCVNFVPTQHWNINTDCSLPVTELKDGATWTFGFQTTQGPVSIGIDTYVVES